MKRILLALAISVTGHQMAAAQLVNDTVSTQPTYTHNVWYSLENGDQGSRDAMEWDIALATSVMPTDPLTTFIRINDKVARVYEIPGSDPADFANIDTTGLGTWAPLMNDEVSWAGAFNMATNLGPLDFGWGNYNPGNHSVLANRIFVIKYLAGGYRKVKFDLASVAGNYTITHDNLDNTDLTTETLAVADYSTKNFVYYNLNTNLVIDREPAAAAWDLHFGQYLTEDVPVPHNFVTGVFQNVGVEVAVVYPVNDPVTYEDFGSATFSEEINTIGWDWKTMSGGWIIEDSTVYFVDDADGDIWKVIMTGFTGSSAGKYAFAKEKISSVGLDENGEAVFATIYPNPANTSATIVLKNVDNATISVYNLLGELVATQEASAASMTAIPLETAALANGTYQIVCTAGSSVMTQRLVVQH